MIDAALGAHSLVGETWESEVTCTTDKIKYCCTECPEQRCQIGDVKRMVGDMWVEAPWKMEALRWCCSKGACWEGEAGRDEIRKGVSWGVAFILRAGRIGGFPGNEVT